MVVATQHFVSTLIMSTSIIRLFQWKWDAIVAALGTNPYVYKVLFAHAFVALLYLFVGSVFAVMDLTLSPRQSVSLARNRPRILGQFCHRGTIRGCEKRGRPSG